MILGDPVRVHLRAESRKVLKCALFLQTSSAHSQQYELITSSRAISETNCLVKVCVHMIYVLPVKWFSNKKDRYIICVYVCDLSHCFFFIPFLLTLETKTVQTQKNKSKSTKDEQSTI